VGFIKEQGATAALALPGVFAHTCVPGHSCDPSPPSRAEGRQGRVFQSSWIKHPLKTPLCLATGYRVRNQLWHLTFR